MLQKQFDFEAKGHQPGDEHWIPLAGRLFYAIKFNEIRNVESVLAEGFVPNKYWIGSKSFLRIAGEQGNRAICELLVRYGADPNEVGGKRGYALLHNAVASGNFGFASILLEAGAAPSPLTSNQATPLHFASRTGQAFLAAKLLDCGADIDSQDSLGRSPLLLAFQKSHACVAKVLIKKRGNLNLADRSGVTPRMVAESRGPPYSDLVR